MSYDQTSGQLNSYFIHRLGRRPESPLMVRSKHRISFWTAIGVSAVILLPTLTFGLGYDHGLYQYMAWAWLKGQWPYRDAFDISFPGIVLIHLVVMLLMGGSALALRAFDFAVQIITAALQYKLASEVAEPRAGVIAALLYSVTYTMGGYYNTAQRDTFLVPLLFLAVLGLWKYTEKLKLRWLVAVGAWLGMASIIRPTYVMVPAILSLCLLALPKDQALTKRFKAACLLGTVSLLPLLLFIATYVLLGQYEILYGHFSFLLYAYPYINRQSTVSVIRRIITYPPFVLALVSVYSPEARKNLPRFAIIGLFLCVCILIRIIESKTHGYYFFPVVAFSALLGGVGLDFVMNTFTRQMRLTQRITNLAVLTSFIVITMFFYGKQLAENYLYFPSRFSQHFVEYPAYGKLIANSDLANAARYLREHSEPSDFIQTWGAESMVYYAAGRLAANRVLTTLLLWCTEDGEIKLFDKCWENKIYAVQDGFRQEILNDVKTKQPKFIIAANKPDGSLDVIDGGSFAPDFPELRAIMDGAYRKVAVFGKWGVWERNNVIG